MNVFKKGDISSINRERKLAEEVFGEGWEEKGAGVYDEGAEKSNIWGIGACKGSLSFFAFLFVLQDSKRRRYDTSAQSLTNIAHPSSLAVTSTPPGCGRTTLPSRR